MKQEKFQLETGFRFSKNHCFTQHGEIHIYAFMIRPNCNKNVSLFFLLSLYANIYLVLVGTQHIRRQ